MLNGNPQITSIRIEGHTDARGDDDKNQALSQARADAVKDFLVGEGVDASRLTATGYGETNPIETNDSRKGRQANRRVVFTILTINGVAVEGDGKGPIEVE